MFYDVRPDRLERTVREYLGPPQAAKPPVRDAAPETAGAPAAALGAIVPHAGYVYSGPVAGAVYAAVAVPSTAVILCPNHTGRGAPLALDPSSAWRTPLGDVPVDRGLAERLLALCPSLEEDAEAHRREHSLEVQLPFLQVLRPGVRIVPISIGEPSLGLCREVGRRKDDLALARIAQLDAEGLYRTVLTESISMCGFLPATALLFAARASAASGARVVARRDSGDETGDASSVVGYAGVVVS